MDVTSFSNLFTGQKHHLASFSMVFKGHNDNVNSHSILSLSSSLLHKLSSGKSVIGAAVQTSWKLFKSNLSCRQRMLTRFFLLIDDGSWLANGQCMINVVGPVVADWPISMVFPSCMHCHIVTMFYKVKVPAPIHSICLPCRFFLCSYWCHWLSDWLTDSFRAASLRMQWLVLWKTWNQMAQRGHAIFLHDRRHALSPWAPSDHLSMSMPIPLTCSMNAILIFCTAVFQNIEKRSFVRQRRRWQWVNHQVPKKKCNS